MRRGVAVSVAGAAEPLEVRVDVGRLVKHFLRLLDQPPLVPLRDRFGTDGDCHDELPPGGACNAAVPLSLLATAPASPPGPAAARAYSGLVTRVAPCM